MIPHVHLLGCESDIAVQAVANIMCCVLGACRSSNPTDLLNLAADFGR
jgi:hypothetical protein